MTIEHNNIINYKVKAFTKDTRTFYIANADPIVVRTEIVNLEPDDKDTKLQLDSLYRELSHLFKKEVYYYKTDNELEYYVLERTKAVLRYNSFKEINVKVYRITEVIDLETEQSYWD